jgi:hypothetical protein
VGNEGNVRDKAETKGNTGDEWRQDVDKLDSFDSIVALAYPAGLSWRLPNEKIAYERAAIWTDTSAHNLRKYPANNRIQLEQC